MSAQHSSPLHTVSKYAPFVVSAGALGGYLLTYARQVTLVDSGELITTSAILGIAHPPGFPLYTLLGHLFSRLPLGSVASRVTLMSAFWAAVASAVMTMIVAELLKALQASEAKGKRKKDTQPLPAYLDSFIPLASGLLFAFSATLWYYASVAEVYTLNTALLATVVLLMLKWRRLLLAGEVRAAWTHILFAAGVYGLGLAVHHVTILLTFPAITLLVWRTDRKVMCSRSLVPLFLTTLAGLSVYLYLPLAAIREPIINWGNPSGWERFYWHVSGKQYQVNLFSLDTAFLTKELGFFAGLIVNEITPVGLLLGVYGIYALFIRERTLCWTLLLVILFDLLYAFNYEIAEDKDAYYLSTIFALSIAAAVGVRELFERLQRKSRQQAVALLVVFCLLPVFTFGLHYRRSDKSQYLIAVDLVENVMKPVEHQGLLLTADWQFYSPYLYMRHIEGFRRDATVIDVNLVKRSWYVYGYLKHEYPQMMKYCEKETEAYMKDLWLFEHDQPYDSRSISENFAALINAFIRYHTESSRAAFSTVPMEPGVAKDMNWVPQGLVMRLYNDRTYRPEPVVELQMRGLLDGSVYIDDTARKKVLPFYAAMLTSRGLYLSLGKQYDEALLLLRKALELNPNLDRAYQGIGDIYRERGNRQEAITAYRMALELNPENIGAREGLSKLN